MSAIRLYSFESILSSAVVNVFRSANLTAYTSFDAPELRKSRPRVDVEVRVGEQINPPIIHFVSNGTDTERRNAAWKGQLVIHIITDPSLPGKQVHSDYRAQVRNILAVLQDRINEIFLTTHKVHHPVLELGTVHQVSTDKGYEVSTITFDFNFTIQADAWSLLEAPDFFPWNGVHAASQTDWVMGWIAQTFNLAVIGTNAAGADDDSYIRNLAWAGTRAGDQAYQLAGEAYTLAVTGTNSADQAYSLAQQALYAAWAGTNLPDFPHWVLDYIGQTYNLSVAGTNAANSADSWGRDAYSLAVAGTNAAAQAETDALDAQDSAAIAQLAARFAQSAADAANNLAGVAFSLAVTGTNAAHEADQWGRDAFSIAVDGTNAAHEADSWARDAFGIAVAGTNAANQAWTLAGEAYTLAQAGTNAAAAASTPAWVMQWLAQTYNLSTSGTDGVNAVNAIAGQALTLAHAGTDAAHEADSWGRDAYSLAVAGTNAAAAAQTGVNITYVIVQQILNTNWGGTNSWALETFQNYDTSKTITDFVSAPLTNSQLAYGTNWMLPATINGTSAPFPQNGFSGTSQGWPNDSFEQYNTGTVFTALTISQGTGWTGPAYIY